MIPRRDNNFAVSLPQRNGQNIIVSFDHVTHGFLKRHHVGPPDGTRQLNSEGLSNPSPRFHLHPPLIRQKTKQIGCHEQAQRQTDNANGDPEGGRNLSGHHFPPPIGSAETAS